MILDNARSIELHLDRCLNQRHFRAACDHCVKVCPAGAIKQDHGQVAIISEECTGCGLCLQECPAEVFTTRKWMKVLPWMLCLNRCKPVELFDRHSDPMLMITATVFKCRFVWGLCPGESGFNWA